MVQNILIVDDEPDIRKILSDLFSREPYGVFSAGSAKDALDVLGDQQIDVVISDEKMPGMSGSEFLSVVRKKFPDTIRMILTGHASLDAAIRSINEGEIYRFFTKPCNLIDLAVTVRQALQHKKLMKKSQDLLKVTMHQSALMDDLEKQHPGITKLKRNEGGAIIIDSDPDEKGTDHDITREYNTLIDQISETVRKYETLFPDDS